MKRITLFLSAIFLAALSFGQFSLTDPQDAEKLLRDKERAQRSEQTFADPSQKMVSSSIQHAPAVRSVQGALKARNGKNISVLVASPNAADFNTHVLSLMQVFGGIDYTVTNQLGALTVEEMLTYDVVWTFNVSLWNTETGSTAVAWSDKLGSFIDQGGFLLESQFVNGWDNWGLGSGLYITGNKSPFIKSTLDRPVALTSLGAVAQPEHPIMSGVTTLSTDYFIQNVTVRSDATLIASWGNSFADPLVAVYDNIVAVNADPVMSTGSVSMPGVTGDGFLMFHNAIVWLYNNQADPLAPAAPTAITATAGAEGALAATLNWTNPTATFDGGTLDAITAVKIYRDGQLIHTINDLGVGAAGSYTDNGITASGVVNYQVAAENSAGEGPAASASVFVGIDVPAAVANLELVAAGNDGLLTWNAPTAGLNGGYFVSTGITYTVKRYPGAVEVATGITETTFTDTNIPQPAVYFYTVQAVNATGLGGIATSNSVLLGAEGVVFMMNGEVTSCEGTFFDSGGPDGAYSASENFTLTFFPEIEGAKMRFNFTSFAVESNAGCTWDALEVFDGPNTDAPLVGRFCGATVPAALAELTSTHPSGAITFRFTSDTSVQHAGWEADFYCYVAEDNDLRATAITGNPTPTAGLEAIYQITVFNEGGVSQPGSAYTVEMKDAAHNVLASVPGGDIASGQTLQMPVAWTPQTAGPLSVYGYVNFPGDDVPGNNSSPLLNLVVQEADIIAVTIGTATTFPPNRVPFDFFFKNNVSQTLYYPEEIGLGGGAITSIAYKNNFTTNLPGKPVRIWIGETELENLSAGWVDPATLTLVFDGTADFPIGVNDIILPLDMPYIYTGGNLVIYTQRVWEDVYFASTDRFYGTEDPNSGRTRRASADATVYDPATPPAGTVMHWLPNTTLFFSTAGLGALEGTVTDGTNPIEGVKVSVMGTMATTYTDEDGTYAFPYLLPGTYDIQFELFGYTTVVEEEVIVEEEETTMLDVTLDAIAQYALSGTVVGNDGLDLEGAAVMLEGYEDYLVLTNADGEFVIEDVYAGTYVMTINAAGYETHVNNALVVNADLNIGTITLDEIIVAPYALMVDVDGQAPGNALLMWNSGESSFADSFEDGTFDAWHEFVQGPGQVGDDGGNPYWFATNNVDGTAPDGAFLARADWGYGIDTWLVSPGVVVTADTDVTFQWYSSYHWSVDPNPNAELMVKVSTDGGNTWTEHWNWQNIGVWINFTWYQTTVDLSAYSGQVVHVAFNLTGNDNAVTQIDNIMIGAAGKAGTIALSEPAQVPANARNLPAGMKINKAFVGFNVFIDDVEVASDITDTHYLFTELEEGEYTAGVQSVYTTGTSDIVSIDFNVVFGVPVSVAVTTNSGGSAQGAVVLLENEDLPQYQYTAVADVDGEVDFISVRKGMYTLTVTLDGYEVYSEENIDLQEEANLTALLVEIIEAPFGLLVETEGLDAGEAHFSWNNNFEVEFRWDDGTATGQLGSSTGSLNTVLGSVHRNNAVLNEMSWYLTSEGGPHATVKVWVFGLNAAGQPDPANVLYSAENVPNVDAQWNTHAFPQPVEAPNGFLIGVSYVGFLGLGTDDGLGDWPFQTNTHYFVGDVSSGTFAAIETLGTFSINFLIRAVGIDNGPLGTKVEMASASHTPGVELSGSMLEEAVVTGFPAYSTSRNPEASKAFVGYNVYLDDLTAPVATQVTTTEFLFSGLTNGNYVAGVQSVYTSGASEVITEPFTITNGVVDELFMVTFNVHMHAVEFDPDTDEVFISGEFPQWVEPGQSPDFLLQTTDDPMILTLTLELEAGDYAYKYFMGTGWNNGEWPGAPDRVIAVTGDMTIDNVFGNINDPVSVPGTSTASLSIFPNPASSILSIVSGEMIREVRMIDMLGQLVYNSAVQGERHELNVAGFRNGIYFVQVLTTSGLQTYKVQIQK